MKDRIGVVPLAMLVAVLMIAQQLAGKAVRDAFFLSTYEASVLPAFVMASSILSIGSVLGTGALYRRFAPATVLPVAFGVSGLWFAVEYIGSFSFPRVAAASLFIHTTSFGAIVVSGFWSVVNESLDPSSAKRNIGRIAGAATLGGLLGGLLAWQGSTYASIELMILTLGLCNVGCAVGARLLGAGSSHAPKKNNAGSEPSVLAVFEETPYLRHLAVMVATTAVAAALVDYAFKARAASTLDSSEALVGFFAQFYLVLGVGTFVFQLVASRASLVLGLSLSVASLSLSFVGFGAAAMAFVGLPALLVLRGGSAIIESSLYRSGYELLFTPLTPEKKRPTKTLIDVGGDKLGAALGGGLSIALVDAFPESSEAALLAGAIGFGSIALLISRYLHRGYVAALEENLQTADLGTSGSTVKRPPISPRRNLHVRWRGGVSKAPSIQPEEATEMVSAVAVLRSDDEERVKGVLRWYQPLPSELLPFVVPHLANDTVREEAAAAILRLGPASVGVLTDVLLSERKRIEERRCVPSLLAELPTRRSLEGLEHGLLVRPPPLRFEVAKALSTLRKQSGLLPEEATVIQAIERFAADTRWEAGADERLLAFSHLLLSTRLSPEPLRLALEALAGSDSARRGTGLEYIENVVPKPLRSTLVPIAEHRESVRAALEPDVLVAKVRPRLNLDALVARLNRRRAQAEGAG